MPMKRALVALVTVGASIFSVYVATSGTVAEQVADMDAEGISPPNRDATCPVRLDADFAADAGLGIYQRAKFPVSRRVMADGGIDIQMPPMPLQRVRASIDVVDWNDCALAASTGPVAALWGTQRPFTLSGVVKPWCRAKLDAGLPCLRTLTDGGTASFGDRNVYPCAQAATPATCERVSSGVVYLGDDPEDL